MDMNIDRREIKREARQALKGDILKLGILIPLIEQLFYSFVYSVFFIALCVIIINIGKIISPIEIVAQILGVFLGTFLISILPRYLFILGNSFMYLELVKGNKKYFKNLFFGFNNIRISILVNFRITLFVLLWSILFLIPGMIKGLGYCMSYFIISENPTLTAKEAMKRSSLIMNGNKWKFFKLEISFIGWALLIIPTFGLILIWLLPYMNTTMAVFYEKIKDKEGGIKSEDTSNPFNKCFIS